MNFFEVDHVDHAWHVLVENVMMKGDVVSPRNKKTKELSDVIVEYPKVKGYSFINQYRVINPVFHLVELIYFLNSRSDNILLEYVSKMKGFENNVNRFDGSYGPSIYEALPFAIKELTYDRDSRRSVIPILRSHHLNHDSLDIPCNVFLSFRVRDDRLDMNVFTRSQDLFYGFLYDTLEFQLLQFMVSNVLGISTGKYIHHIMSLHLYEDNFDEALLSLQDPSFDSASPDIASFADQEAMWSYVRRLNAFLELASYGSFMHPFDDISAAIISWKRRAMIGSSEYGIYQKWVKWWLEKRKNSTH